MRYKHLLFVFLGLFFVVLFWRFTVLNQKVRGLTFISPLPQSLAFFSPLLSAKNLVSENLWFPDENNFILGVSSPPEISARAGFVIDLTTNKIIYSKNSHGRQPVASTVKIMTAIVALENKNLDDKIIVEKKAATIGEDAMGISEGEIYTLQELLYGLMLNSGNDAAEAIAAGVAGNSEKFIILMNEKAKSLGLKDTKFATPSGLDGDQEQYSTAYDLAVMARYAMGKSPVLAEIVKTKYYQIPYTQEHKELYLENQTNLLETYPGVVGIKPGYTEEAGLCLVTLAINGGHEVLGVILGSNDRRGEMRELLDYSFSTLGVKL